MFDTVSESTLSNDSSQKLGKNPSALSRNQTCDLISFLAQIPYY